MIIANTLVAAAIAALSANGVDVPAKQVRCMADNIFFEARGAGVAEWMRVTSAVLNRVESKHYPNTPCEVIYQSKQFSWTHDPKFNKPNSVDARIIKYPAYVKDYQLMLEISGLYLHGLLNRMAYNADHYHTKDVAPNWADPEKIVFSKGIHIYYDLYKG